MLREAFGSGGQQTLAQLALHPGSERTGPENAESIDEAEDFLSSLTAAGRHTVSALAAYSAKGLSTWVPASSKSFTLRVTTVMPCTRAVAAMSASITGRGCVYC